MAQQVWKQGQEPMRRRNSDKQDLESINEHLQVRLVDATEQHANIHPLVRNEHVVT
jgi:hypothetical protein